MSTSNGTRIAAWHFGTAMKDEGTSITCVSEYHYGTGTKLLVGLETGTGTGMLCVFDVKTSKVVKAIDLPQRVGRYIDRSFVQKALEFKKWYNDIIQDIDRLSIKSMQSFKIFS